MTTRNTRLPSAGFALLLLPFVGCGASGLPLLGGDVAGEFKGVEFTPAFGIAYHRSPTSKLIILGDQEIDCETPTNSSPPVGNVSTISLTSLDVGTYGSVLVHLMQVIDGVEGRGSNSGRLSITMSTTESVTGTISFHLDDDDGQRYGLNGSFQVTHCAP